MGEHQREFFDEFEEKDKKKSFFRPTERSPVFFSSSVDAFLLGFVLLVMGIVIVYAVGVEVGKREKPKPSHVTLKKNESLRMPLPPQKIQELAGKYTVQVASFAKQETAEKALADLRKKKGGREVFLIPDKTQVALCVGGYENRLEANRALQELQKEYHDAFVRNR